MSATVDYIGVNCGSGRTRAPGAGTTASIGSGGGNNLPRLTTLACGDFDQAGGENEPLRGQIGTGPDLDEEQWGDNTTCVTANTSEPSYSCEDLRGAKNVKFNSQLGGAQNGQYSSSGAGGTAQMRCARYTWLALAAAIGLTAFASPVIMVVLPKTLANLINDRVPADGAGGGAFAFLNGTRPWHTSPCLADCQGMLLSFSFKMLMLAIATWLLFLRRSLSDMPRLYLERACLLALLLLITFAYWLFYGVRIVLARTYDYSVVVTFAVSMADALIVVHYLAVAALYLRSLRPEFRVRVVRSPDGESRTYTLGACSLQQAATSVLHHYYTDFSVYNPFLERLPTGIARMRSKGGSAVSAPTGFKMYTIDGEPTSQPSACAVGGGGEALADVNTQTALMVAAARRRDSASAHNERFYEELEWERRVRKRRARLLVASEEAFAHIARRNAVEANGQAPCVPMDSREAAQAVFPALARPLQKYLRVTRQQPRHTAEQVVGHLSQCLALDASPRAFLERFFVTLPTYDESSINSAKWSIVSERPASSNVSAGTIFALRCRQPPPAGHVQLVCTVTRLPFLNLTEHVWKAKMDRFVLRLNSETSV